MSRSTSPSTAARLPTNVPVLILRLQGTRYPYVCADIARTLGRLGIEVYLLHAGDPRADGRSHWLRRAFRIPSAGAELETLVSLGSTLAGGTRPVLIAVDDPAAFFVDEHADELSPQFLFPRQPGGLVDRLSNKGRLHELCAEIGLSSPPVTPVDSQGQLQEIARSLPYPIVLKVADARVRQSRSVAVASSPEELLRFAGDMQAQPDATNLLIQEYVAGGPGDVWMFNGYFGADSNPRFAGTARKLRQYPADSGVASLGVCEPNARIHDSALKLAEATGYRGAIDIDYRYDARDDAFKILDVNPRVGTSFRLFADARGADVVQAMYFDLLGARVDSGAPVLGRRWIVENYDLRSAISSIARGQLTAAGWVGSLRGVDEAAWFARDDPAPFAAMVLDSVADLARMAASRVVRAASALLTRLGYRRSQ